MKCNLHVGAYNLPIAFEHWIQKLPSHLCSLSRPPHWYLQWYLQWCPHISALSSNTCYNGIHCINTTYTQEAWSTHRQQHTSIQPWDLASLHIVGLLCVDCVSVFIADPYIIDRSLYCECILLTEVCIAGVYYWQKFGRWQDRLQLICLEGSYRFDFNLQDCTYICICQLHNWQLVNAFIMAF